MNYEMLKAIYSVGIMTVSLTVMGVCIAIAIRAVRKARADREDSWKPDGRTWVLEDDGRSYSMSEPAPVTGAKPVKRRAGATGTGSDWLSRQMAEERRDALRVFDGEARFIRQEHLDHCDAAELRSSHEAACGSESVMHDTAGKMTREEIKARKAELKRRLGV